MKKMTAGILAVALSSSLYAGSTENYSEGRTFIGAEVGYAQSEGSISGLDQNGWPLTLNFDGNRDAEFGFHIGAQDGEWRTTLMYNYFSSNEGGAEETTHKGGLYLDYFIWSSDMDTFTVQPYIGGHVGYMTYELTADLGYGEQVLADDSNVYYGGQVGIAITASEVLQIDISYRYSLTNLHDITGTLPYVTGLDVDLDSMSGFVVGLNYFF